MMTGRVVIRVSYLECGTPVRNSTDLYKMIIWLLFVGIALIGAYAWLWNHWRRARDLFAGLPTYPQLPLIGSLHLGFGGGSGFPFIKIPVIFQRVKEMSEIIEEKILPFVFWLGPCPVLLISDPEDIKTVTNTFIEKPYYYNFGRIWLGDGLVLAPGHIWKQNVKKIAGTFTTTIVNGYQSVFNAQAHKLVQKLKGYVGREPFDVMHDLAYTTLETICQTALGVPKISENIVTSQYYQAFNRTLELFISRGLNVLLHPEFIYRLTPSYRELKKCIAIIHNVSDTIIQKRKLERKAIKKNETFNVDVTAEAENEEQFKAFLDILMDLSESDPSLTEKQIKSEVDTIIVGGQETVASTLFYTLLMIGCKPQVQDKLFAELNSIFAGSTRPVTKEDLSQMKYLEAIINETLRMFPPLPVVMRYAGKDLQLKSCIVPKGTACGINAWGAGRSLREWGADGLTFRPERWLGAQPPGSPAAFLAFSYGRRACIGKRYAIALLKTILAYCVRELEFVSEADKLQFKLDVALRPTSGHLMQIHLRQKHNLK